MTRLKKKIQLFPNDETPFGVTRNELKHSDMYCWSQTQKAACAHFHDVLEKANYTGREQIGGCPSEADVKGA